MENVPGLPGKTLLLSLGNIILGLMFILLIIFIFICLLRYFRNLKKKTEYFDKILKNTETIIELLKIIINNKL